MEKTFGNIFLVGIAMIINNRSLHFAISIIAIILTILIIGNFSFADDFRSVKKLIKNEMIYPRRCKYLVPASIPSKEVAGDKNEKYLKILKTLRKMELVELLYEKGVTKVDPAKNTYDIIKRNINLQYELLSINLVLGTWDIELDGVKTSGAKTIVTGRRILKNPTRLYNTVIDSLPNEEKKKYRDIQVQWKITKEKDQIKVVEKQLD